MAVKTNESWKKSKKKTTQHKAKHKMYFLKKISFLWRKKAKKKMEIEKENALFWNFPKLPLKSKTTTTTTTATTKIATIRTAEKPKKEEDEEEEEEEEKRNPKENPKEKNWPIRILHARKN